MPRSSSARRRRLSNATARRFAERRNGFTPGGNSRRSRTGAERKCAPRSSSRSWGSRSRRARAGARSSSTARAVPSRGRARPRGSRPSAARRRRDSSPPFTSRACSSAGWRPAASGGHAGRSSSPGAIRRESCGRISSSSSRSRTARPASGCASWPPRGATGCSRSPWRRPTRESRKRRCGARAPSGPPSFWRFSRRPSGSPPGAPAAGVVAARFALLLGTPLGASGVFAVGWNPAPLLGLFGTPADAFLTGLAALVFARALTGRARGRAGGPHAAGALLAIPLALAPRAPRTSRRSRRARASSTR